MSRIHHRFLMKLGHTKTMFRSEVSGRPMELSTYL